MVLCNGGGRMEVGGKASYLTRLITEMMGGTWQHFRRKREFGFGVIINVEPVESFLRILGRMPNIPVSRLPELLPWNWSAAGSGRQMAA